MRGNPFGGLYKPQGLVAIRRDDGLIISYAGVLDEATINQEFGMEEVWYGTQRWQTPDNTQQVRVELTFARTHIRGFETDFDWGSVPREPEELEARRAIENGQKGIGS